MTLRLGLGLQITRGVAAFNPLSLDPLAFYDPSDTSTLFQDAAGTTPVTTAGDPVRLRLDKSANGYDATAPSDAARPVYQQALPRLVSDGVDDHTAFSWSTRPASASVYMAVKTADTSFALIGSGVFGGFIIGASGNGASAFGGIGSPTMTVDGGAGITTRAQLYTALSDGEWHIVAVESADFTNSVWATTQIGAFTPAGFYLAGATGDVFISSSLAASQSEQMLQYMAGKYGVTL